MQMQDLLRAILSCQINKYEFAAVWHVPVVDQHWVVNANFLLVRAKPICLSISCRARDHPIQYMLLCLSLLRFYVEPRSNYCIRCHDHRPCIGDYTTDTSLVWYGVFRIRPEGLIIHRYLD